jgi:hypothetical protein
LKTAAPRLFNPASMPVKRTRLSAVDPILDATRTWEIPITPSPTRRVLLVCVDGAGAVSSYWSKEGGSS